MTDPRDELLQRAREGDARARGDLLEGHRGRLEAYLRLKMGASFRKRESAADLVQSVFLLSIQDEALWRAGDQRELRGRLLLRADHKLVDHARFHGRGRRDVAREHDSDSLLEEYGALCTPSREVVAREELERIEKAIDALPDDQRRALLLSRFGDMSVSELAHELERSENAVYILLSRAMARLSILLDEG